MNLAGLSSLAQFNRTKVGTGGFLTGTGGGGRAANSYPGTYGGGVLPGGYLRASPSNTGQARKIYGVDFPVVGYPGTGWDSTQRTNENIIPGATGEPQVITTQNIPPNENVSPRLATSFYLNPQEFGGGPNAPTYRNLPASYPAPDMNIPTNEDVSPGLVDTFLSDYNPNSGRGRLPSGGYPDLSGLPPVTPSGYYDAEAPGFGMNNVPANQNYAGYIPPVARASAVRPGGFFRRLLGQPTGNFRYPVPGAGGLPSTFGGGQSWQSNASRSPGGFAGLASNTASAGGFGGGLTSQGQGGWQTVSELPSGLGSMSWQQALGGGFQHYQL